MNKTEFLEQLAGRLDMLPESEIAKSVSYYAEMVDDRVEDGMSEEEAVQNLGDMDGIVRDILCEVSIPILMKAKMNDSRNKMNNKALWLTLVIAGFPVWLPLLLAVILVIFAVYIVVWAVIVSLFAAWVSLGAACVAGVAGGLFLSFIRNLPTGMFLFGAALICGALTLFLFHPLIAMTKQLIHFTAFTVQKIKMLLIPEKRLNYEKR